MKAATKPRPQKATPPRTNTKYQIGDRVTNARGWHGRIDRIDTTSYSHPYYWVYWKEREEHEDKLVKKYPICGHLEEQIWKP